MTETREDNANTLQIETDTVPFNYVPDKTRNGSHLSPEIQLYGEGVAPCERNAEEYNMNHPRRGRAVLFNHFTFDDPKVQHRIGTLTDVQRLSKTLGNLDFDVIIHNDLRYGELMQEMKKLSRKDHKDCDCLMIIVLTHGHEGDTLMSRDTRYNLKRLWEWFTADQCIDLAGKPKILIIQACKGASDEKVVSLRPRVETDGESRPGSQSYSIPSNSDFLVAFSSVEGFYSNRDATTGSWFIQSLCQELDENAGRHDLLKLLTRTCRRVALTYETTALIPVTVLSPPAPSSPEQGVPVKWYTQQMPSFLSTLTRDLYLRPKRDAGTHPPAPAQDRVPESAEGKRHPKNTKKKERLKSFRESFRLKWGSKKKSEGNVSEDRQKSA